ncbi:hypothetical protein Oweho_3248 [Owenweeksia hongkongensis DSM 17368]|uniref:Uncharacterized protein n=1 Tax=Owenweeksia hongkongensis (strain DSM 17368 / CIP 108786 / JCM 12287 / NRRL B-23963 / UST20020801) TaxID=926562 RepID=G8R499_OWEHD|nr:hypothetical protein Oweho_3248 [Owenweeksia hongkongensis DSM 17368]
MLVYTNYRSTHVYRIEFKTLKLLLIVEMGMKESCIQTA